MAYIERTSHSRTSNRSRVALILALVLGLGIGWIDLHTTEVSATILALVASGTLLGLVHPNHAWRWGLVLTLGVPIMAFVGLATHLVTPEPIRLDIRVVLVALVFALVGCYGGVGIRRVVTRLGPS